MNPAFSSASSPRPAGHGAGKPLTKRVEEDAGKWTSHFEQLSVAK